MQRFINLCVIAGLFMAGPALAATTQKDRQSSSTKPDVVMAEFGIFDRSKDATRPFIPTRVVPHVPNQGYGWIIALKTDKPKIKWREEFTLPNKPDTWGDPEQLGKRTVSKDGRVSVTERTVEPKGGVIFNSWAVAPGDPKGRYVIRVFVEGALAKEFEFDVQ